MENIKTTITEKGEDAHKKNFMMEQQQNKSDESPPTMDNGMTVPSSAAEELGARDGDFTNVKPSDQDVVSMLPMARSIDGLQELSLLEQPTFITPSTNMTAPEINLMTDSLDVASSYYNMGCVCQQKRQWNEALRYYEKAMSIQELMVPDSLDLASTYYQVGCTFRKQRQYEAAIRYYEKALSIQEHHASDSDNNNNNNDFLDCLANTCHHLGFVWDKQEAPHGQQQQRALEQAVRYYEKAKSIREITLPESLDLAHTYHGLGVVLDKQHDWEKAVRYFEQARIIVEVQAPESLDLASTYHNLASVLGKQHAWEEAKDYFEKAQRIQMQSAPQSLFSAFTYHNLGSLFGLQGQLEEARRYYEQALLLQERKAPDSLVLAYTYHNLGLLLEQQNGDDPLEEAVRYYEKALSIRKQQAPPNSPDLANTYYRLGSVLCRQNQLVEAARCYQVVLRIMSEEEQHQQPVEQATVEDDALFLAYTYHNL